MIENMSQVKEPAAGPTPTAERLPAARREGVSDTGKGRPRVVVVGGGFGGLYAARALHRAAVDITLVDRNNYHLFQPLLYQVATGALSPGNIAAPLRGILSRQKNAHVLLAEAVDVDPRNRRLILDDGELPYDYLVLAPGAGENYFGNEQWRDHAPSLKTLGDALEIRRLLADPNEQTRSQLRNFVENSDAIEYAFARANEFALTARQQLSGLPDSVSKRLLEELSEFATQRNW